MPPFLFNLNIGSGDLPYIASVAVVGTNLTGYRGLIRRFPNAVAVAADLEAAGIELKRYKKAVYGTDPTTIRSFEIDLNEAQKLSLIQTDTTE